MARCSSASGPVWRSAFTALLLGLLSTFALALPSDSDQPIRIQSDSAELDEKEGLSIYRGRVVIIQGSMRIDADKVTVNSDEDGVSRIVAVGMPAHYQHKPKPEEPEVHAYGEVIQFLLKRDEVVVLKNARLTQGENQFQGDRINYDISKQLVKAHSSAGTTTNQQNKRVEIVIQPAKKPE